MRTRVGLLLAALLLAGCSARERIRAGDGYMETGRYAAAGRAYAMAVDRRPRNSQALEGAAAAWLANGDPERALTYARRATERQSSGTPLLAETLLQLGRGQETVTMLEDAVDAPERDRWLAEALLATGELNAALSTAQGAEHDDAGNLAGLLGWLNARLDNDEAALSLAHRLRGAESPQARADAAAILLLLGDDSAANLAKTVPVDVLAEQWWAQAAKKLQSAEKEAALRQFMWLWALSPGDARYTMRAGQLLLDLGEPAPARRALSASLAVDDEQREVWHALAMTCQDLEDWHCSAHARSKVLDMSEDPSLQDWLDNARAWRSAGSMPDLIAMWEDAVKRQPEQPTLYYHLAGSLMEVGQINQAIGFARLAWKLAPGDAEIALLLGELYTSREEYTSAADIYRQSLASNPGDSRLRASLKTVLGYIPY